VDPAAWALLADVVPASAYGRAYGLNRRWTISAQSSARCLPWLWSRVTSVRTAILVSIVPGLLAAGAIVYAIGQAKLPANRERRSIRFHVRPLLQGSSAGLVGAFAVFEIENLAVQPDRRGWAALIGDCPEWSRPSLCRFARLAN
jgi:hypothetical protein